MDRPSKGMTSLKTVIDKALESLGMDKRLQAESAVVHWEDIVGPEIAKNAKAVKIDRGTLLIEVKSAAWKQQLQMMAPQIIRKINHKLGSNTIKSIRFR